MTVHYLDQTFTDQVTPILGTQESGSDAHASEPLSPQPGQFSLLYSFKIYIVITTGVPVIYKQTVKR